MSGVVIPTPTPTPQASTAPDFDLDVDLDALSAEETIAWDERFGLWKLNPLADWDEKQVWNYIKDHHVPYNELHDRGYPSIGCMPCTTVAVEGAGERAGRWAGSSRTECGIHG
jgi:phosphoadenylyl-sulfate reductase (thioredoxin)